MTTIIGPDGPGTAGSVPAEGETLITIVLDKSGSMEVVRTATIDGFNAFRAEQAEGGADALVSLTVFDWEPYEVCTTVPIREVTDLSHDTYVPSGSTALYDAIGTAIRRTDELITKRSVAPQRVLFAVITDGEENASRHFDRTTVFDLVRSHEKDGWTFVFLGANIDSYAASRSVGVQGASRTRDWLPREEEMRRNMRVFSHATSRWRGEELRMAQAPLREFFTDEDERAGRDESR